MHKGRLEAFSDAVIAIIMTIMVLEMKIPHEADIASLLPLGPVFLSYILSFVFIGVYWNNHHHFMQVAEKVNGRVLWANLHLLFWLSLFPFVTGWMGENHFAQWPVVLYGVVMLGASLAAGLLALTLVTLHGKDSVLAATVGNYLKGQVSLVIYIVGIATAIFVHPWIACALYAVVAAIWVIPERKAEKVVS